MTNEEYIKNVSRLKEIEAIVKNPESSLDGIEALIEETRQIVSACYGYTRGLKDKVETLNRIDLDEAVNSDGAASGEEIL